MSERLWRIGLMIILLALVWTTKDRLAAEQGGWTRQELPEHWLGMLVSDVDALSGTDVWAVGDGGIAHYDGVGWTVVAVPEEVSRYLNSIDMYSATDGWAVGSKGTLVHWDGASWEAVASPTSGRLVGVDMVSSTDVWAVEWRNGQILHYDGSSWSIVQTAGRVLHCVNMVSASDGWIGAEDALLRYNGSWSVAEVLAQYTDVMAIDMLSATEGWAADMGGIVYHYSGGVWSEIEPDNGASVTVRAMASDDVWTAGRCSTVLHYDGVSWTVDTENVEPSDSCVLNAVDMLASGEGWAVGGCNLIMHHTAGGGGLVLGDAQKLFLPILQGS